MQLNPNQRANAEGRYCTVLYGPVLHKTQCLKLNLLLASLTAQAEGDFCSPEERLALLHRVFPLPLLSRSGAAIRWPFSCNAGIEQEQARISGAHQGEKSPKPLSKCFLHRHHNLKTCEAKV